MKHLLSALAGMCALFTHFIAFSQNSDKINTVDLPAASYKTEPVNMYVSPDNSLLLTYQRSGSIPKYFQFSANSNDNTLLTVQINVGDGDNVQTITKSLDVTGSPALYEIPIQQYLTPALQDNSNAVVKSVLLSTKSNSTLMIRETNFSSTSVNYPIGINQVFVMDMSKVNKRYFIHTSYARSVNINIYDTSGVLQKKEKTLLSVGDNFMTVDMMLGLLPGKYIVLVTDASNMNISNTMMVMF